MSHAAVDSPRSKDAVDWVSCFWYPLILQVPKKFKKNVSSQFMTVRFKYFKVVVSKIVYVYPPTLGDIDYLPQSKMRQNLMTCLCGT